MDKQSLEILMNTYWQTPGWRHDNKTYLSPEDFAFAKSKGMMFDNLSLNHEEALHKLFTSIKSLNKRIVTDGFLASLSSRRLDWRSALGSYAVFQNLTAHLPAENERYCYICGFYFSNYEHDLNVLNFERFKWGGVRHLNIVYASIDLDLFIQNAPPSPTNQDIQIFQKIVSAISQAPKVGSAALQASFSKILKSNKSERDVLIVIFGFCGILGTPEHPGFTDSFIPANRRELPNRHFIDMSYPACWWQSDIGINQLRLNEYFGYVL